MSEEGRQRSGSLKEKFDGFFTRRTKGKVVDAAAGEVGEQSHEGVHIHEAAPAPPEAAVAPTAPPQAAASTAAPLQSSNEELIASPEPKQHGTTRDEDGNAKKQEKTSPPILSEASLEGTASSLTATNREGSKLKMSFTDALAQLARKHGVYYTEGSIHKPQGHSANDVSDGRPAASSSSSTRPSLEKSVIHEEIVWWMYDSTQQPTAGKWHHRHHQHRSNGGEGVIDASLGRPSSAPSMPPSTSAQHHSGGGAASRGDWMGVEPPNSLLLLASMSHRPHAARATLQVEDVRILEHIQWPLVSIIAGLAQDNWRQSIRRHVEDPRKWVAEIDAVLEARGNRIVEVVTTVEVASSQPVQSEGGDDDAGPLAVVPVVVVARDNEAEVATAPRHETHLRHRLLDFFERYDPQRMPSAQAVSGVIQCGITEQTLFDFLRSRYGLSASAPQMFLSGGSGAPASVHERVPSTHQHSKARHEEYGSPKSFVDDLASPLGYVTGASPDFCLVPGDVSHHLATEGSIAMHSESVTTHPPHSAVARSTAAVSTDHWPASWTAAVLPLVPTSVEVVLDGATWNSQASKPGLANPRTTFATASVPTQLFTYNGAMMELSHEAMEANTILSRSSLISDRSSENIGELIVYPKSQAAALRAHRSAAQSPHQKHLPMSNAVPSNEVLDALDATLRSSTKTLNSPSHPPTGGGRRRRRGAEDDDGVDPLGDHFARAMLDSTLLWSKHTGDASIHTTTAPLPPPSSNVKHSKPSTRRQVVWQHPVTLPFPQATTDNGTQKELVLFLEDHWDLDDLDLRPVQSPLSFL